MCPFLKIYTLAVPIKDVEIMYGHLGSAKQLLSTEGRDMNLSECAREIERDHVIVF
jgi:uncharacterized protein YggU (UPF0235/DUF167 family)